MHTPLSITHITGITRCRIYLPNKALSDVIFAIDSLAAGGYGGLVGDEIDWV